MSQGRPNDSDRRRHLEMSRELSSRVELLNQEGLKQGALRPEDASHYPTMLRGMVQGVLLRQLVLKQPLPVDEAIAPLLRCFLDGAAPRP
jgi:transcriptional regulator BetI-like protein